MKIKQLFLRSLFAFLAFFLPYAALFAQQSGADNGMANLMYESGKIYVVVGVILLIFIGIVFYLVALDRRIKKMEEEL